MRANAKSNIELGTITDEEIAAAFKGTNFGHMRHRELLEQGCLKCMAGYISGYTLTGIMKSLGLVTDKFNLTKKGKMFCYYSFHDSKNSG